MVGKMIGSSSLGKLCVSKRDIVLVLLEHSVCTVSDLKGGRSGENICSLLTIKFYSLYSNKYVIYK